MEEMTTLIAVNRRIDLPGLQEPMLPGEYSLAYRLEVDPVDNRQVYYHSGEAIRIEDLQRYLLWGHQIEALLQSPHVTVVEPAITS
jgi:hypothetical protein